MSWASFTLPTATTSSTAWGTTHTTATTSWGVPSSTSSSSSTGSAWGTTPVAATSAWGTPTITASTPTFSGWGAASSTSSTFATSSASSSATAPSSSSSWGFSGARSNVAATATAPSTSFTGFGSWGATTPSSILASASSASLTWGSTPSSATSETKNGAAASAAGAGAGVAAGAAVAKHLEQFIANEKYSDMIMIVGEEKKRIAGHRVVLAAGSPLLETRILAVAKGTPVVIDIPNVEPLIWMAVLQAIYTDQSPSGDTSFLLAVLTAARAYDVDFLADKCSRQLRRGINTSNAYSFMEDASLATLPFVTEFVDSNLDTIIRQPGFTNLSEARVIAILNNPKNRCDEGFLWSRCLQWADAEVKRQSLADEPENKSRVLTKITPLIRFPTMSMQQIIELVVPSGILSPEQQIEVFIYVGAKGSCAEPVTSFITTPRIPPLSTAATTAFAGFTAGTASASTSSWASLR